MTDAKYSASDIVGTKFYKALHLQGDTLFHVDGVDVEPVQSGEEPKLILRLKDEDGKPQAKRLVMNVTNSNVLIEAYGDDFRKWEGVPIILYPTKTQMQGKEVDCIRLKLPTETELQARETF